MARTKGVEDAATRSLLMLIGGACIEAIYIVLQCMSRNILARPYRGRLLHHSSQPRLTLVADPTPSGELYFKNEDLHVSATNPAARSERAQADHADLRLPRYLRALGCRGRRQLLRLRPRESADHAVA